MENVTHIISVFIISSQGSLVCLIPLKTFPVLHSMNFKRMNALAE